MNNAALRQFFKMMNRFMRWLWRLDGGRMLNVWPSVGGRIMIIRHTGRKSGQERLAPVNYAIINGEVHCVAGFGEVSDWYRNLLALPTVELWLPGKKIPARAEDVSNDPHRLAILREVLKNSGFAAPLFAGIWPGKTSNEELNLLTRTYKIIRFISESHHE